MSGPTPEKLFKPTVSKSESKSETTNNASRQIIHADAAKREAKTERLRAARLAHEAAELAAAPEKPVAVKKKRKAASV